MIIKYLGEIMSELKELIDEYIELEEKLDEIEDDESEEYNKIAEKLDGKGHEIDHLVYSEEFVIVYNADTENDEVVALIISNERNINAAIASTNTTSMIVKPRSFNCCLLMSSNPPFLELTYG